MTNKLDYGILYCNDRNLFYAELMFNDVQWGEITIDGETGKTIITIWDCNFTLRLDELLSFLQKASSRLLEFESSKIEGK